MQIQMPAHGTRSGKERGHHVLQPRCPRRFVTLRKLRPAPAEHAVNVAHQIPFILRPAGRLPRHHQHAALQAISLRYSAQQQIDNLNGRRFIPVNAR
jgi:hypothetical protein